MGNIMNFLDGFCKTFSGDSVKTLHFVLCGLREIEASNFDVNVSIKITLNLPFTRIGF